MKGCLLLERWRTIRRSSAACPRSGMMGYRNHLHTFSLMACLCRVGMAPGAVQLVAVERGSGTANSQRSSGRTRHQKSVGCVAVAHGAVYRLLGAWSIVVLEAVGCVKGRGVRWNLGGRHGGACLLRLRTEQKSGRACPRCGMVGYRDQLLAFSHMVCLCRVGITRPSRLSVLVEVGEHFLLGVFE